MWYNKEEIYFNQNQQMMAQKNRKDAATRKSSSTKNEVDFELLWRILSKIQNRREGDAWEGDY